PGKGDPGFTPERDRRMILLSCVTLIVMSLIIFWMVQGKLQQLSDVTGAYAQVSFTAADTVRSNSTEMEAGELVAKPSQHTAQWIESSGTVAYVHDKKGDAISWDKPNAALGSVYWLEC